VWSSNFILFCLGTVFFGAFAGFAQLYRFATADAAPDDFKAKTISLIMAGGVVAAFVGPKLAILGKDFIPSVEFLGVFFIVIGLSLLSALVVMSVEIPNLTPAQKMEPGRPIREIMRTPIFIIATLSATIGQAVRIS
jgi:hypothetical protein